MQTLLSGDRVAAVLANAQSYDSCEAAIKMSRSTFSTTHAEIENKFEETAIDARGRMSLCNLVQNLHATPGHNQTRSQMVSSALKLCKVEIPSVLLDETNRILGKKKPGK